MTDPTQTPMQIDASPVPAQFMAGVRQAGAAISVIASVLGFVKVAGIAGDPRLLSALGVIAYGIFFIWGQAVTRIKAKQLTVAATHAPDAIAQIKP